MKKRFRRGLVLFIAASAITIGISGCGKSERQPEISEQSSAYVNDGDDRDEGKLESDEERENESDAAGKLVNRMTEKEAGMARETEFQLLDKPWEKAADSDSSDDNADAKTDDNTDGNREYTEDYSSLSKKICFCEGIGGLCRRSG